MLKKAERATGVIKKVAFTNPHGALTIEIKNKEGANRLKAGDVIQVSFNPTLNGGNLGFLRSMTLPDKTEAEFAPN